MGGRAHFKWGQGAILGGGPTLLMSVHPLVLAKCSQNRQTKIDKNYFVCALRVPGCLLLIYTYTCMCSFKMVC